MYYRNVKYQIIQENELRDNLIWFNSSNLMLWKNWLMNRLGSLVIVAGPRHARFFHGPQKISISFPMTQPYQTLHV